MGGLRFLQDSKIREQFQKKYLHSELKPAQEKATERTEVMNERRRNILWHQTGSSQHPMEVCGSHASMRNDCVKV